MLREQYRRLIEAEDVAVGSLNQSTGVIQGHATLAVSLTTSTHETRRYNILESAAGIIPKAVVENCAVHMAIYYEANIVPSHFRV